MKKNFKQKAWTMVELIVSLMIIIFLSTLVANNFKPVSQKARIFLYAGLSNLSKASVAVVDEFDNVKIDNDCPAGGCNGVEDKLCAHIADAFTLNGTPDCTIDTSNYKKDNMTLANGSIIYGLTNVWKNYCEVDNDSCRTYYKDIMIDIDGTKGKNKMWVDQFPLRLFDGEGVTGVYYPADCGTSDVYYGNTEAKKRQLSHAFCASGDNTEFTAADNFITYNIYRPEKDETEPEQAFPKRSLVPPSQADCIAYGGLGIYKAGYCITKVKAGKDYKLMPECVTREHCNDYAIYKELIPTSFGGTTVTNATTCRTAVDSANPLDLPCFALIHKPSGGANVLLNTALNEIDF